MLSERRSSQLFHPQLGCDSAELSPLKRAHTSPWFSAETGSQRSEFSAETGSQGFFQKHWKLPPRKAFQRPRARDKKLRIQEVNYIQAVGALQPVENSAILPCGGDPHTPLQWRLTKLDHFTTSTPQAARPVVSERKRRDRYDGGGKTSTFQRGDELKRRGLCG